MLVDLKTLLPWDKRKVEAGQEDWTAPRMQLFSHVYVCINLWVFMHVSVRCYLSLDISITGY